MQVPREVATLYMLRSQPTRGNVDGLLTSGFEMASAELERFDSRIFIGPLKFGYGGLEELSRN